MFTWRPFDVWQTAERMTYFSYYDASGTQGSGACLSVVGVLATESRWKTFDKRWTAILGREGVTTLHMKDFIPCRGEFSEWKDDGRRRETFLLDLLGTLRGQYHIFAAAIVLQEFNRVNHYFKLAEVYGDGHRESGAYSFLADNVRAQVRDWMKRRHVSASLRHVFEAGDTGQKALKQYSAKWFPGYEKVTDFLPKYDPTKGIRVRPFEAADLIAWPYRRMFVALQRGGSRPDEVLLKTLIDEIQTMVSRAGFFSEKNLARMCSENTHLVPPRE